MRVLHVVEALGGVLSSVCAMVDATPDIEHHLALWQRREHSDPGDSRRVFAQVHHLASAPHRATRDLRELTEWVKPDVVHAHSSYAGVLARSADLDGRLAYSPHCFAFERRDLGALGRTAVREVERSLVRRTDVLVACSPHEAVLAAELGHRRIVTVPNRALRPPSVRARRSGRFRAVTVGRVTAQKDWEHLIAAKLEADRLTAQRGLDPIEWEWLGSGEEEGEHQLRAAGIEPSGWIPRSEVVERLTSAQVYVHTAAWEGAPMSILEAAAVGMPLAVRAIPPLASDRVPGLESTVEGLAERILDLRDPMAWTRAQRKSLRFAAEHSASLQRYRLNAAYQHAPAVAQPPMSSLVGAVAQGS